tara:strand:- start:111 stop:404 length:294 start_codon:yes stop_codon:yes gene_type:complete
MKTKILIILLVLLTSCETVSKKINEKTLIEEKNLSKFLNKSSQDLKISLGEPDKINLRENGQKVFIYKSKKFKIKCVREFEIDRNDKIFGFKSKNCF